MLLSRNRKPTVKAGGRKPAVYRRSREIFSLQKITTIARLLQWKSWNTKGPRTPPGRTPSLFNCWLVCECACMCANMFVCYLADSDVVSWLLKVRCVVVAVPNNDANLMQNHGADQLVSALNLNHNGLNIRRRLRDRKRKQDKNTNKGLKAVLKQQHQNIFST